MNIQLNKLIELSVKLGEDPMLVQGAGGNTSIKDGSSLWIKASGKKLADAKKENIFVELNLQAVQSLSFKNEEEGFADCLIDRNSNLKPSIETSIHAVMPQKVVLHVHSIRTISWSCRSDHSDLAIRLDGLKWKFIPYNRPGIPLTKAILQSAGLEVPDILILENHGLIVAGETLDIAEKLLREIEVRLDIPNRPSPEFHSIHLEKFLNNSPYKLPSHVQSHDLATDEISYEIATNGTLYPDHVVFLGPGVLGIKTIDEMESVLATESLPPLILIKSLGTIVLKSLSKNAEEMVLALALLTQRIQSPEEIKYLSKSDEIELCNWDAEKFRQSINS